MHSAGRDGRAPPERSRLWWFAWQTRIGIGVTGAYSARSPISVTESRAGPSRRSPAREPTVYLLPECENEEEARQYLGEVCGQIFEAQLDGWYRVPATWPNRRDLDVCMANS